MWTQETEGKLRELYAQGMPHSEIAAELGISRNATIGKAHRLGLEKRRRLAERTNLPRRVRKIYQRPALFVLDVARFMADILPTSSVTLIELGPHQCRFPVSGEGLETRFCARHAHGSYCPTHHEITHWKPHHLASAG